MRWRSRWSRLLALLRLSEVGLRNTKLGLLLLLLLTGPCSELAGSKCFLACGNELLAHRRKLCMHYVEHVGDMLRVLSTQAGELFLVIGAETIQHEHRDVDALGSVLNPPGCTHRNACPRTHCALPHLPRVTSTQPPI